MKSKWIFLSLIVIAIMISVPFSFAQDLQGGALAENNDTISVNHYYFDSNADTAGNGSIDSPYKYLTNTTVKENSVLHFADGNYNFTQLNVFKNVSFIGSDVSKTVIQLNESVVCTDKVVLRNITFINTQFSVSGVYNATNIIFKDSTAKSTDRYSNSYGGAIYAKGSNEIYIDNCTFINNTAQYGGAIYIYNGILDVKNSIFIDNYAYNYGGAIACEYNSKVKIKNSSFTKSRSINDAGGAVYLKRTNFEADSLNISDSNATFGAALTVLYTNSTLNGIYSYNNTAKYDGGAVYQVLGNLTLSESSFISNNANNGAGLYVGRCDNVVVNDCLFRDNNAISQAGAFYSIINTNMTFERISYENNVALLDNDFYNSQIVNPFISNINYTLYSHGSELNDAIPSFFMLDNLWIKDQQDGGNCWAFASLASLESCIFKASGEVICLSEENMKNLIALYSDYGWKMDTNYGGYDDMSVGYLVSWLGPVLVSDDLYDGQSLLSPVLDSVTHVQNIMYLSRNSYTDNNAIKRAIMNYGGVYTSIYATGYYEQYYTGSTSNHAICIVGWDDDKYISRAPGKGAWICKNSWGYDWGHQGFFYVSYYDRSCAPVGVSDASYVFIFNDTLKYDKNYQYDIPGKTDYFLNSSNTVWYKNKFTSTDNEYLAAVSTYFLENTNWELSIFVNNALKSTMEGFSTPGYYTIELDDMISLIEGDDFEIVFKITVDGDAGVPISESQSLVHQFYKENISYISYDGINWVDFYDLKWKYSTHTYKSQVACIKAFTVLNPVNTTLSWNFSLDELDRLNLTALVLNQYGKAVHEGKVIFNINSVDYAVDVDKGIAKIASELMTGLNNISARYDAVGFTESSQSTTVHIDKLHEKIDLDISQDFGNVNITVKLTRPINETVIVTVAANPYNLKTKNGIATLKLEDMALGKYDVNVMLQSEVYQASDADSSFTLAPFETVIEVSDLQAVFGYGNVFKIRLVDENSNVLSDKTLTYTLDSVSYTDTTDKNGFIYIRDNLTVGSHNLNVKFNGTKWYSNSTFTGKINIISSIILPNSNIYTYNSTYRANFIDELSNKLSGKVDIIINGVKNSVDLVDGVGSANILLNPGSYAVSVVNPLNGEVKNQTITVVKRIQENNDLTTYYSSGNSFKVKLLDDNGNVAQGLTATFNINGKSYSGTTDSNGYAYLNLNLNSGVYTITSSYKGFSVKNTLTVKSTIDLPSNTVYTYNSIYKPSFLDKTGNPLSGKVAYIADGVRYEVNVADGLNVALSSGSHVVSVINLLTGEVKNQTVNVVDRIDGNNDLVTYYGSGDSFRVRVLDDNGNAAGNVNVAFTVGGKSYSALTDSNGYASLNVNLPVDVYTVIASYKGFSVKNTMTVKSTVALPANTVYTYNSAYKASFLDKTGNSLSGKVAYILNGVRSEVNSADAITVALNSGSYVVSVINLVTGEVKNQTVNVVDRIRENSNMVTYYGSGDSFRVKVLDDNGNAAGNVNVAFTGGGKSYSALTDSNGYASLNVNLPVDVYEITASYKGFSVKNSLTVKSTITMPTATVYTYNSIYRPGFIDKSGNKFTGKVAIVLNGVRSEVNANDGVAIVLNPGSYSVSAINLLTGEVKNQTVNVVKRIQENNDLTAYYGSDNRYKVKVLDDNGNAAGNVNVVFTVAGKSYTAVTDSRGYASLNVDIAPDVYTVEASYKGFSVKNTMTVKSTISLPSNTVYTYNSVYKSAFLDKSGNPSSGKVAYIADGVRYEVNAADGFTIALNPGSYIVSNVNLVTGEVKNQTINVVKRITENNDITTYYDVETSYKVKVLDDNGNAAANVKVTFTLDGKSYTEETDSNGYASLSFKLSPNVYTVEASYKGFSVKNTVTVTSTIALPESNVYTYNSVYRPGFIDKSGNKYAGKVVIVLNGVRNEVNADEGVGIMLNPGSYAVSVINLLTGEVRNQTVNVVKRITDNNDLTTYYGSDYYKVKVLDDNGNVASNLVVTFTVNGKEYSGLTDSNGYASLNVNLPVDVYTVEASYKGFSVKNALTVKTTIDLPESTVYTYNSVYRPQFLDKSGNKFTGKVAVVLNGIRNEVNAADGIAVVLNPGSYVASVINLLTGEVKNQTVNVVKRISENNDLTRYYGSDNQYTVKVLDDNGNVASNLVVTFTVNGNEYSSLTDDRGYASLNAELSPNVYTVEASYKGFSVENKLTVKSTIDLPSSDVYTYNSVYKAEFLDKSGNKLSGNVAFIFNDVRYDVNAKDGIGSVRVVLNPGNYIVSVSNPATGEVKNQTIKILSRIQENNDLITYYGDESSFKVKVLDDNGNVAKNAEVTFNIDGRTYSRLTDNNGYASLDINLSPGSYSITSAYNGYSVKNTVTVKSTIDLPSNEVYTYNSIYKPDFLDKSGGKFTGNVAIVFNGIKYEINALDGIRIVLNPGVYDVSVSNLQTGEVKQQSIRVVERISENRDLTTYYGSGNHYKVKVLDDNGNAVSNLKVTFTIGGKNYFALTDDMGYASLNVNLAPKVYSVMASYNNFTVKNKITIKTTVDLLLNQTDTYDSVYKVSFLDKSGNKLSGKVTVIVDGVNNEVVSDNGMASISLNPGTHEVSVINPVTGEVKNQTVNVISKIKNNNDLTMYFGAGKYYKVKILDYDGKIAKNVKVTFKINGKTYSKFTDSKGYASIKIDNTFAPKTYTITTVYKDNTVTNKITVKPTLICKNMAVKKGKTFKYTVKLLNNKGKILKYKYVKVTFKGKTYKVKTNSKGMATFKIKVNSKLGKFTITSSYGKAKISKKITVKK